MALRGEIYVSMAAREDLSCSEQVRLINAVFNDDLSPYLKYQCMLSLCKNHVLCSQARGALARHLRKGELSVALTGDLLKMVNARERSD